VTAYSCYDIPHRLSRNNLKTGHNIVDVDDFYDDDDDDKSSKNVTARLVKHKSSATAHAISSPKSFKSSRLFSTGVLFIKN
jgi:hypothetical protein